MIFSPAEISDYLEHVKRLGPFGHICSDDEYEVIREMGMVEDDPVAGAEEVLIFARMKELLL